MKKTLIILGLFLVGCSNVELENQWKNPSIDTYLPQKVLVVGMTPNIEARQQFEAALKNEYDNRAIEAVMSLDLFDPNFTTDEKTEEELKKIENKLLADGFDTILFTKVVGVEDKIVHSKEYNYEENTKYRFNEDYLMYQDVYYNPSYYDEYTVYKAETSLFCICPTKDRELVWKGFVNIIDPTSTEETVDDYVKLLVLMLDEQNLLGIDKVEELN